MEVDLRRLLGPAPAGADRYRGAPLAVEARRIAIVGNTGSGKTTLARRLADRLGVPHVELDALFWLPEWQMRDADEFRARVDDVLRSEGWVVDGNYFGRLGERVLRAADVVVWLDPPLATILWRLVRRTVRRVRSRELLWETNRDTWRKAFLTRDSLFVWALKMHFRKRAQRAAVIARYPHVRLRSRRDVNAWLAELAAPGTARDDPVTQRGGGRGTDPGPRQAARVRDE